MGKKLTSEEVASRLFMIHPNIEIIGIYQGSKIGLPCRCKVCKNEWSPTWSNLGNGHGCPVCSHPSRLSIEVIEEILKEELPDTVLCENQIYKGASHILKWKCGICENEWSEGWSTLRARGSRTGCVSCNPKKGSGLYSLGILERNKEEWKKIVAILYKIKIFDDNEIFYKVGITTKSTQQRFNSQIPYNYEIIEEIKDNLYNLIIQEQHFHNTNKNNSYLPLKKFCGYTECYKAI